MGGVGDERPLPGGAGLEPVEHRVERAGQRAELVVPRGHRQRARAARRRDEGRAAPQLLDRAQRPPEDQPDDEAERHGEQRHDHRERDAERVEHALHLGQRDGRDDGRRLVLERRGLHGDAGDVVVGARGRSSTTPLRPARTSCGSTGSVRLAFGDVASTAPSASSSCTISPGSATGSVSGRRSSEASADDRGGAVADHLVEGVDARAAQDRGQGDRADDERHAQRAGARAASAAARSDHAVARGLTPATRYPAPRTVSTASRPSLRRR